MIDNLGAALVSMGFEFGIDFVAADDQDGKGPHISVWLSDKPRPTDEEIAVAAEKLSRPLVSDYSAAIENLLNSAALERRYDSINTAVSYRDDPNPTYAAEGKALFEWRSAVWTYATMELAKVQAGEREQPTVEAFVVELPTFTWPAE